VKNDVLITTLGTETTTTSPQKAPPKTQKPPIKTRTPPHRNFFCKNRRIEAWELVGMKLWIALQAMI
jgi:hypothetical protein